MHSDRACGRSVAVTRRGEPTFSCGCKIPPVHSGYPGGRRGACGRNSFPVIQDTHSQYSGHHACGIWETLLKEGQEWECTAATVEWM